jgi:hypothetical protein
MLMPWRRSTGGVHARRAGLGRGLDQAEEAQFGVTDEELERARGDDDE